MTFKKFINILAFILVALFLYGIVQKRFFSLEGQPHVRIYTTRDKEGLKKITDTFFEETGIKTIIVTDTPTALVTKMEREGPKSPADVFLTADIGSIIQAKKAGQLQPLPADGVNSDAVSPPFRDEEKYWVGVSKWARLIFYAKDKLSPGHMVNYEDMANPEWQGRLLASPSHTLPNQAFIASMVAKQGMQKTNVWIKGMVANFARSPKGSDLDQLQALLKGKGDIALANTFDYIALLQLHAADKFTPVEEKVGIIFPDQQGKGVHINISSVGITAKALHVEEAKKFIAFLLSGKGQGLYSETYHEYPVVASVASPGALQIFGKFKEDTGTLAVFPEYLPPVVSYAEHNGWE